ncbi:MAG: ADP-ribosylglycohydrolase family protein [Deferrisomatales bacterium]
METIERYRGCLLGLAAGDAVGTAVELRAPGTFAPVTEMTGGGPFRLAPGQWTDDTSMALCLAESLVERRGLDPGDQLRRYLRWYREGYWSSTGACFDIGGATRQALERFERTGEPHPGDAFPDAAGNGSLMRLGPVPLFYAADPAAAAERSGESSRTTHGARAAVDACRYFGGLLAAAVNGAPKAELLAGPWEPAPGYWDAHPLCPEVREVALGSWARREPPAIRGSGYVIRCLEAALWAFHRGDTFREGCLLAVNLGDDADTTAAVYGQLAGAHYGEAAVPAAWRARLALGDRIGGLAELLHARRQRPRAAAAGESGWFALD